jgi:hypothetical protein
MPRVFLDREDSYLAEFNDYLGFYPSTPMIALVCGEGDL